jgi:hypothetical protein
MGLEDLRGLSDEDYRIAEGFVRGSVLLGFQASDDHDPTSAAAAEMVRPEGAEAITGAAAVENFGVNLMLPIGEELDRERPDIGHLG